MVKIAALYTLALQASTSRISRAHAQSIDIITHPQANVPVRVDAQGEFIKDSRGNVVVFDARTRMPVVESSTGMPNVVDATTGTVTVFRRRSFQNDLPADMIKSALENAGSEHQDPDHIQQELFDEYGVLDPEKLEGAMKKYAAEDIYMAMIKASPYEEWEGEDGLEGDLTELPQGRKLLAEMGLGWKDVRLPERSEATLILVSHLAFARQNAPYTGSVNGKMPVVLLTEKPPLGGLAVSIEKWRLAFVPKNFDQNDIVKMAFHELCHLHTNDAFKKVLQEIIKKRYGTYGSEVQKNTYVRLLESTTEFIATLWSRNSTDVNYETDEKLDWRSHKLTLALVSALSRDTGNLHDSKVTDVDIKRGATDTILADLAKGVEILCQAYFTGDGAALKKLQYAVKSLIATQAFQSPSSYYSTLALSQSKRDHSEL